MTDTISLLFIAFAALMVIGPDRLPRSLEALWLVFTDFSRARRGLPPLQTMENARRVWAREKDFTYGLISSLYHFTAHLNELRKSLMVVVAVMALTFIVAFVFSQQLLAAIIRPISVIGPFESKSEQPINVYTLSTDVPVDVQVPGPAGPITTTIVLPEGTRLPLALPSPRPVFLHPTELFTTYMKISALAAFGVSLPVLLWQILLFFRGPKFESAKLSRDEWEKRQQTLSESERAREEQERADVFEGLTAREVGPLYFITPLSFVLFVGGVLFTYFLVLPAALSFLYGLGGNLVQPLPALDDYIGFAMALLFWVGLSFELPLVMFFLARFRIMTWRDFLKQWRIAVVIIAVVAAVITPTTDPFNMSLVAAPMLVLYAFGIGLAWSAQLGERRARAAKQAKQAPTPHS